jgi:hypothetical protein
MLKKTNLGRKNTSGWREEEATTLLLPNKKRTAQVELLAQVKAKWAVLLVRRRWTGEIGGGDF